MVIPLSNLLEKLLADSKIRKYQKGEIVIRSDDNPNGVYYLKSGYIKMNTLYSDGRELTFNIYKAGTFFPMIWAIADIPNSYLFAAMTACELYKIDKNSFLNFLNQDPKNLFDFTKRLLIGTEGHLTHMKFLLTGSSKQRIAAALIILAKRFGIKNGSSLNIMLPLTHQDIASLSALTRETTSMMLTQLKKNGLITYNHQKVAINNMNLLEKIAFADNSETDIVEGQIA
jgi:CRP-like cAMP-binding protein